MKYYIRTLFMVLATVLISSCFFHRQMSWLMEVEIVNNAPCFLIPADVKTRNHHMSNNGLMISKWVDGSYQTIWTAQIMGRKNHVSVIPGKCLVNDFDDWQEGQYTIDTGIWFDSEIDQRLYYAEFYLIRDPQTQQLKLSDQRRIK